MLDCNPFYRLRPAAKRQEKWPLCGGRIMANTRKSKSFGIQGQWPLAAGGTFSPTVNPRK
jgi:hypothetical protein